MFQTFKVDCRKMPVEADGLGLEAEAQARFEHLHVFNFGRSVGGTEHDREAFGVRVRWVFLRAAVGVTFAAAYLQIILSGRILPLAK